MTKVTIAGHVHRPVMMIFIGCDVKGGGHDLWGAVILDQYSTLSGNPHVYGTLAYYHRSSIGTPTVSDDPQIRAVMADVAPRFFLTAVRVFRH